LYLGAAPPINFRTDDIPDAPTDAAGAFGALLALAPLEGRGLSDELGARRRALRFGSETASTAGG